MNENKKQRNRTKEWLVAFFIAAIIALFLRYFILIPIQVKGISMRPTLEPDSYIVYEPFSKINRFDIVLFRDSQGEVYIKRVIGIPGDTITYQDDQLMVDNQVVEETFLNKEAGDDQIWTPDFSVAALTGEEVVPKDSYFVLGDNRSRSKDSRMFGFIPRTSIEGKARMVIFPFDDLTILP